MIHKIFVPANQDRSNNMETNKFNLDQNQQANIPVVVKNQVPEAQKEQNKKRKKIISLAIGFVVLVVLFVITRQKEGGGRLPPIPSPTPRGQVEDVNSALLEEIEVPYYLNRTNSLKPVNGYLIKDDKIFYSTTNGVFEGYTNKPLLETTISYINFNLDSAAVFKSADTWQVFNFQNNQSTKIQLSGEKPLINKDASKVTFQEGKTIKIFDLNNSQTYQKEVDGEILKTAWAYETNLAVIQVKSPTSNKLVVVDTNLSQKEEVVLGKDEVLQDISQDGQNIVLHNSPDNLLIVRNLSTDQVLAQIPLYNKTQVSISFVNNNQFILIETTESYLAGRNVNYISLVNTQGVKKTFTNTNAIPQKLNTSVKLASDSKNQILPLVENDGILWLLSLKPNLIPVYSEEGIGFYKAPPSQGDEH